MKTVTVSDTLARAICLHQGGNSRFAAREIWCGTRYEFSYNECCECGYVQIERVPDNLGEY